MLTIISVVLSLILSAILIYFTGLSDISLWFWFLYPVFFFVVQFLLLSIWWVYVLIITAKYKRNLNPNKVNRYHLFHIRILADFLLFLMNAHVYKVDLEKIDKNKSYLMTFNHVHFFDPWVIYKVLSGKYSFVGKKALNNIPIVNQIAASIGSLYVDANDKNSGYAMVDKAVNYITEQNTSVILAPEGTRNNQEGLLPFKHGGFNIALKSQCDIVLFGLKGMDQFYNKSFFAYKEIELKVIDILKWEDIKDLSAGEIADLAREKYLMYLGIKNG